MLPCSRRAGSGQYRDGSQPSASEDDGEAHHTRNRLISALVKAYVTFATAFFVVNARFVLSWPGSTPAHWINLFTIALVVSIVFCMGLLVVHAPVLGLVRRWFGNRLKGVYAGLLGAALAPGPVVIYFVALHDLSRNETSVGGWIELWTRFPGEFLLSLLPFCVGSVVFALRFAQQARSRFSESQVL
jgi:hypothetical protein